MDKKTKIPSPEEIEFAVSYLTEKNFRIPIFNYTGVFAIDEAEFILCDYSDQEKKFAWMIAFGLNQGLIDEATFLSENNTRVLPKLKGGNPIADYPVTGQNKV